MKEISGTVPSLRLDTIVGTGFGMSRSRASRYIKEGRVKLKGQVITNASRTVDIGDEITVDDAGSCHLMDVLGETKKGRIKILIQRYPGKGEGN